MKKMDNSVCRHGSHWFPIKPDTAIFFRGESSNLSFLLRNARELMYKKCWLVFFCCGGFHQEKEIYMGSITAPDKKYLHCQWYGIRRKNIYIFLLSTLLHSSEPSVMTTHTFPRYVRPFLLVFFSGDSYVLWKDCSGAFSIPWKNNRMPIRIFCWLSALTGECRVYKLCFFCSQKKTKAKKNI